MTTKKETKAPKASKAKVAKVKPPKEKKPPKAPKEKKPPLRTRWSTFVTRNKMSEGYLLRNKITAASLWIFRTVLIFGLCFLILQPILNQISVSFMAWEDLFNPIVISVPYNFSVMNFQVVSEIIDYWPSLLRTIGITLLVSVLQIIACTLAGYGFARYKFPFKNFWFMCVILTIIVPPQTIMAPLYLNFRFFDIFGIITLINGQPLNLLNTLTGYLILVSTGMGLRSGLYIFMLRQHFRNMPKELEEAAYVDGCGQFRTFLQIMLPDAKPMVVSCFLFSFVWQWTDSFYATLFLNSHNVLAIGLGSLADRFRDYYAAIYDVIQPPMAITQAVIATGMLMTLIPLIILYIFAQRAFVESVSQTGIKM